MTLRANVPNFACQGKTRMQTGHLALLSTKVRYRRQSMKQTVSNRKSAPQPFPHRT